MADKINSHFLDAPFLLRGKGLFISIFLYLALRNLLSEFWEWNASDVLVYAKHFVNPHWIPNDWFLNLPIHYRDLFNLIAGTLALKMPFFLIELTGRFLIILLFAYVLTKYSDLFDLSIPCVICFLGLYFAFPNIVAGEWIIGGFETKCFAYFFTFLSLLQFIQKKYKLGWAYLGLAVSFHVLVGLYATFCLLLTLVVNRSYFSGDMKKIIKFIPGYIGTASLGIYTCYKTLLSSRGADTCLAGKLYVTLRVPHHTLPSFWVKYHGGYWWVFELLILVSFLLTIFLVSESFSYRIISSFALGSSLLFGIGLLLFVLKRLDFLRYYWFRFPDVIIPFFSFFLFFSLLNGSVIRGSMNPRSFLTNSPVASVLKYGILAAGFCIFLAGSLHFMQSFFYLRHNRGYLHYATKDVKLRDAMLWIRRHTSEKAKFLINPYIEQFYMVAQRPILVSFKHVPASEKNILEWYKRLKLCNGNVDLSGTGFKNQHPDKFYALPQNYIEKLAQQYNLKYLLGKSHALYSFPVVYYNRSYAIYRISPHH